MSERSPKVGGGLWLLGLAAVIAGAVWLNSGTPGVGSKAQIATVQADLKSLGAATRAFAAAERRLPNALGELLPRYLAALPKDPWGRDYVLKTGGPGRVYLWCLGADGALNRQPPDICEIVNWEPRP